MKCPNCNKLRSKVTDSRYEKSLDRIRRRRECLACEFRYTTYECITENTEDKRQYLKRLARRVIAEEG